MDDQCTTNPFKLNSADVKGHILINTEVNAAMCFVPKTGCTFWKRVLYTMQEASKGKSIGELFDIGKRKIHSLWIRKLSDLKSTQQLMSFWHNATKIVFARDPYSRLYSAYVDKFFLPDFWSAGARIKRLVRNNVTVDASECGHDVTFEEFLRYVIHAEETGQYIHQFVDDHWQPVTRLCQPCGMSYDVVAKQETFSKDRDFIVDKLGISSILPTSQPISKDDTNKDAINQTIDTYWGVVKYKKPCVSQLELARRFWRSYQIQGYLPSSLKFPEQLLPKNSDDIKEDFRKLALDMYESNKPSSGSWKQQRLDEMTEAYKDIPTEVMEKIKHHFRKDFQLFSYEMNPRNLYSYR